MHALYVALYIAAPILWISHISFSLLLADIKGVEFTAASIPALLIPPMGFLLIYLDLADRKKNQTTHSN